MSTGNFLPAKLDGSGGVAAVEPLAWAAFQKDFGKAAAAVPFKDAALEFNRHPHPANSAREHTYWHMVTEGQPEEARTAPELDRLERVPWARPVLEHAGDEVKRWGNVRGSDRHFCIWHSRANYLIVVKQTVKAYLLKTTYCPTIARQRQLHQEFAEAKRRNLTF